MRFGHERLNLMERTEMPCSDISIFCPKNECFSNINSQNGHLVLPVLKFQTYVETNNPFCHSHPNRNLWDLLKRLTIIIRVITGTIGLKMKTNTRNTAKIIKEN